MSGDGLSGASWAAEQLTTFLSALTRVGVEDLPREGVERVAEAFEAEVAALVVDGEVVTAVGFPRDQVPCQQLVAMATIRAGEVSLPTLGSMHVLAVPFDEGDDGRLVIARAGEGSFTFDERTLLRGMGRVLSLSRRERRALAEERAMSVALRERQTLLERTARVQRSIVGRVPLGEVLETIVSDIAALVGGTVVEFRRISSGTPGQTELICVSGSGARVSGADAGPVEATVAGRAIAEDWVVVDDAPDGGWPAMAAPVHEDGMVVGSLAVTSAEPGRCFSAHEQDVLVSFADLASLALSDARMVNALRDALRTAQHDAMHDVLTGLPNRALLRDRLSQATARAARQETLVALLFLDLDDFKQVNDSLGHDAGDQLLVAVAQRLANGLRDTDTVARLGGDEFAILIDGVRSFTEVEDVADRLLTLLVDHFVVHDRDLLVHASVGIAVSSPDGLDGHALLRNADLAMYEAKRSGGSRYVHFHADMHHHTLQRLDLEQQLRQAVTADELFLHYQPIHDITSGATVAVEALVRWEHPTKGLISPNDFIPVAESTRLIKPIGEWVLHEAARQAVHWPANIKIAVNVSPLQVDRSLVDVVRHTLAETGLHPSRLKLEVTEGTVMDDSTETRSTIRDIQALGVRFAIDDFGTGQSSLARLRQLPVDQIKIDRSFVADASTKEGLLLLDAIIALARGAGLVAVAEGVETEDQLRTLQKLGCDQAQGFWFERPASADVVGRWLGQQSGTPRLAGEAAAAHA